MEKINRIVREAERRRLVYGKIWELHKQGVGPSEISRQVGLSRQRIYQILRDPELQPEE